jgi:anti-anti-sigma factor
LFHEEKVILATLEKLGAAIDARNNVQMVVDMSTVEYLSSAGLGRLVGLLKKAVTGGGAVHFACLRPEIRELFEVMQLTKILKLFPTVEAAVAAYGAPSQ